eukprot:1342185-Amorphochlora_amoeboformis.AAC.2
MERQKLLCRGRQIKKDKDLERVKPGAKMMLMGTAEELKAPTKKYIFEEDLTATQKAELIKEDVAGLNNLGNTCYMNSTVQCLRSISELKGAINKYKNTPSRGTDPQSTMLVQMGQMFNDLDKARAPITPVTFVNTFRRLFPRFAQRGENGHFLQQDADECLMTFMDVARSKLDAKYSVEKDAKTNVVQQLFGFETVRKLKCTEGEEEEKVKTDLARKLTCHIDEKTNFLVQGIEKSLNEVVELKSESLGRNAQYQQTVRLKTLPKYMVVQFVRFYWKKELGKKCKMLRVKTHPKNPFIYPQSTITRPASYIIPTSINRPPYSELFVASQLRK